MTGIEILLCILAVVALIPVLLLSIQVLMALPRYRACECHPSVVQLWVSWFQRTTKR